MKTIGMAGIGGLLVIAASLPVFAASSSSALFGNANFAPIVAALLALAFLAQGGRRRLRM